jgi:hypothetical protein
MQVQEPVILRMYGKNEGCLDQTLRRQPYKDRLSLFITIAVRPY